MSTRRAKKAAQAVPTVRLDAIVGEIASHDSRPHDTPRTAKARTHKRLYDAINRGDLKPDASGKAVPAEAFWRWALGVAEWRAFIHRIPGCPSGRTITDDLVDANSVSGQGSADGHVWRDEHEWLRARYPQVMDENLSLKAKLEVAERENAASREQREKRSQKLSAAGKKGGRPKRG